MISSINDAILRRFLLSRVQIKQYRLKTIFTVCRLKIKKIFEIKIFFLSLIKKATNQDTKETTNQKICYNLCCNLTMFHQMSSLTKNIKPEKTIQPTATATTPQTPTKASTTQPPMTTIINEPTPSSSLRNTATYQ